MRIISGSLKGSKISLNNKKFDRTGKYITRPTTDRVKETLFNIIQNRYNIRFDEVSFFDCFSGSGAIGLEALSRGSKKVLFLDKDYQSCKQIKDNLKRFKIEETGIQFLNQDFFDTKLCINDRFDLIFMDPPYGELPIVDLFSRLRQLDVTKTYSLIIYESNKEIFKPLGFDILNIKKVGKTYLTFLRSLKNAK